MSFTVNRRQILATLGATTSIGCLRLEDTGGDTEQNTQTNDHTPDQGTVENTEAIGTRSSTSSGISITENWPQFQYNPQHTGFVDQGDQTVQSFKPQWQFGTGERLAFSSPAVMNETVYIASWDGHLYAVDTTSGDMKWRLNTGEDEEWSSPTVVDGIVFFGSHNGIFYALNASDGSVRWKHQTEHWIKTAPIVGDEKVFVGNSNAKLFAFDKKSGGVQWVTDRFTGGVSGLVYENDIVYAVARSENEQVQAYTMDGEFRWSKTLAGGYIQNSPALIDNTLYVGTEDGTLLALNTNSGSIERTYETEGAVRSSPATDGERVYVGSHDSNLHAIDSSTGDQIWTYQTQGRIRSSPVIKHQTVFVGSDGGTLHAINKSDGTLLTKIPLNGLVTSSAAIVDDFLFIGSENHDLYCLRIET